MGPTRQVLTVCMKSFFSPCKIRNACFQPRKIPLRQYTNPSLEGPFYTRLSSRLKTSHKQNINGLESIRTDLSLTAAKDDLIQEIELSNKDGLPPETIANNVISYYRSFGSCKEKKEAFLSILACDLGVDGNTIVNEAQQLINLQAHKDNAQLMSAQSLSLRQSLTPFYSELFSYIARVEGGIKFLVDLRGDLLALVKHKQADKRGVSVDYLTELSLQLKETLGQWFIPQLMDLQHITWESSCDILEKISQYEAVHRLRHWKDLKHRVGPNRRCFIFTHKAVPREPIAMLHVALTSQPSCSIQELLNRTSAQKDPGDVSHAIFYSISATQRGLSGIELGNYLIQQAAKYLQKEFSHQLSNFVTLSPIPGFRRWLESNLKLCQENKEAAQISREDLKDINNLFPDASDPVQSLQVALATQGWATQRDGPIARALEQPLSSLCAKYLVLEKHGGHATDPVAHFHLQNGASVWRVNWLGDTSPKGLERSFGLMVNYRYQLPDMSTNSDAYRIHGNVLYSDLIASQL